MILYVSVMGLTEALGRAQVLNYVSKLSQRGWPMTILSLEKPSSSPQAQAELEQQLASQGIGWIRGTLQQPATPRSRVEDLLRLATRVIGTVGKQKVKLLHCRSYIAATVGLLVQKTFGIPYIFDIRGFWPDERIESGAWQYGWLHSSAKVMERQLYSSAAAIVSLTHAAVAELPKLGARDQPVEVIPTCVDLDAYRGISERSRDDLVIGYLGSFGGRYLIDDTVRIFSEILRQAPHARLSVLTPHDPEPLWAAAARHHVPREKISVGRVPPGEIPARLAEMSATICLIKPGFASLASCPTKFGESLAAGCPVVCNPGIGDCADLATQAEVGVSTTLEPEEGPEVARALLALLEQREATRARCARIAEQAFSLEGGVERYSRLYARLLG